MAAVEQTLQTKTEIPQEPASRGEVAIISPPRLPYHPLIQERFGVDRAAWKALTDAVFPAAKTTNAVILALSYCKARKLDPFKRVVHIVPVYDTEKGAYVETVWPGIAEHRTTAFRTKQYAGADAAEFGEELTNVFSGQTKRGAVNITMKFPKWCQLTVYRMIDGQRVPVPGPRIYWLETYSKMGRTDVPNERWQRAPYQMIEKCAEAAALRRAFPEELGDEPTAEEAESLHLGPDNAKDVTPAAPIRPQRGDFDSRKAGHADLDEEYRAINGSTPHDPDTGEITERTESAASGSPAQATDAGTAPASPEAVQSTALAPSEAVTDGAPTQAESQAKPATKAIKTTGMQLEPETTTEAVYRNLLKLLGNCETKKAVDTLLATDKRVKALQANEADLYDIFQSRVKERLVKIEKAGR